MPLRFRRQLLGQNYIAKRSAYPIHYIYTLITDRLTDWTTITYYQHEHGHSSWETRNKKIDTIFKPSPSTLDIRQNPSMGNDTSKDTINTHQVPEGQNTSRNLSARTRTHTHQLCQYRVVDTDGSKTDKGSGCALYTQCVRFQYGLNKNAKCYTCESIAINNALDICIEQP
jgi:hypothetical protein